VEATRVHLEKVLRNSGPLEITYTDGSGLRGKGVYSDGWIQRGTEQVVERPHPVTIAVAPPRNKSRARFVVEKLAEIGVARLLWLTTVHTEGRTPRMEKSSAWAQSAMEQSQGAWLMEISGPVDFSDVGQFGAVLIADREGDDIDDLDIGDDAVLCVGPEGGFSENEVGQTAIKVRLGDTTMRVETAALVGAVLLTRRIFG